MPSLQWLLLQCPVCQPEDSLGAGTQRPYNILYAANQAESKPLLAVACCKFMQIQHVAGKPKKKRLGGWACPTKGLEKNRNLSLSFEGLTLLKGSGPIIQKSESPTASAGKERHHQKIGSTVTRHSSIHKLTRKSPGRRVLAEPVDLGKHLLTLCICIYVTFALQKSTACSCTCPAACSTKSAQFGQLLQKIFRSPRWPAIL